MRNRKPRNKIQNNESHSDISKPSVKQKVAKKIANSLDVPENAFISMPQIELSGNREAIIDGCKGILEYDESLIKLNLGSFMIKFTGTDLMINSMNDETSVVSGYFSSIEFTT